MACLASKLFVLALPIALDAAGTASGTPGMMANPAMANFNPEQMIHRMTGGIFMTTPPPSNPFELMASKANEAHQLGCTGASWVPGQKAAMGCGRTCPENIRCFSDSNIPFISCAHVMGGARCFGGAMWPMPMPGSCSCNDGTTSCEKMTGNPMFAAKCVNPNAPTAPSASGTHQIVPHSRLYDATIPAEGDNHDATQTLVAWGICISGYVVAGAILFRVVTFFVRRRSGANVRDHQLLDVLEADQELAMMSSVE
eukprot:TRINITY_DN90536_c0_g1_i1.p1 TRINITY_DN90536_c0_g1~~TRINITY_DN90536_c0_g1_i1.p1  ORF type:complete len:255 (-),score=26.90 TRINITY_DN90536_c0_g1_i1:144-908(-)